MTVSEGSIEKVVESAVRAQVSKMIVEGLEGVDGLTARIIALRAEVERQLTAQRKGLAESMVNAFATAAGDQYRLRVVIEERPE